MKSANPANKNTSHHNYCKYERTSKSHLFSIISDTIKHHKLLTFFIFFTVAGAVIISLLPPLVLGSIVEILAQNRRLPFYFALGYFALIIINGLFEAVRDILLTIFGQKITHSIRSSLMQKMTHLNADALSRQEPGSIVSRFVGDVDTVETLFTSGIISMIADACKIMSILCIIFFKNTGLAIILLITVPIIFLFTRIVQKHMLSAQLANRAAVSRVTNHVPETIKCIRMIHNLNKEKYMQKKYDKYLTESYVSIEKSNFYDAIYSPIILILNAVIVSIVMLLSASGNAQILTLFGMSVGTSVTIINYISQIFSPIESLGMEIQTIQSAIAGVKRINIYLNQPERKIISDYGNYITPNSHTDRINHTNNTSTAANKIEYGRNINNNTQSTASVFSYKNGSQNISSQYSTPAIQLKNVTFGYEKDDIILHNLSFNINAGEQVTLSGRTGAGKSTIFKLLLGLYQPLSGEIYINGTPVQLIPDNKRRQIFGYVEQIFHPVAGTIKDQIAIFDSSYTDEQIENAAKLVGIHEAIIKLPDGYDTIYEPTLLSQGQWQLLSIARAVITNPSILLLDEITASLDAETERNILDALSIASKGRTTVSISHRVYGGSPGRVISI